MALRKLPAIRGIIDRRILANYRLAPDAAAAVLPAPFRPKLVKGYAIGGLCLIRLKKVRPAFLPVPFGLSSENAAHRIAVEWEQDGQLREGVYIPRRDTNSLLNVWAGGRIFPGEHYYARFRVQETSHTFNVSFTSHDDDCNMYVDAKLAKRLNADSIFANLDKASHFFEAGSLGYSATSDTARFDGLELDCKQWSVQPLDVHEVRSSFFNDKERFPEGAATFDCGLLMRGIDHRWYQRENLCCPAY